MVLQGGIVPVRWRLQKIKTKKNDKNVSNYFGAATFLLLHLKSGKLFQLNFKKNYFNHFYKQYNL